MISKSKSLLALAIASLLTANVQAADSIEVFRNFNPDTLTGLNTSGTSSWNFEQVGNRIAEVGTSTPVTFDADVLGKNLDTFQTIFTMYEPWSTYPSAGTSKGFYADITLTMKLGEQVYTDTFKTLIKWNATSDPLRQVVNFDISDWGLKAQDGDLEWSIAFNTQNAGYSPTGVVGPTNSLNIGVIDGDPYSIWLTSDPWDNDLGRFIHIEHEYQGLARTLGARFLINVVPEPTSLGLLALGGATLLLRRRKH